MHIDDYQKIPRSRRLLFYRYGPVVFDPQFDLALGVSREKETGLSESDFKMGPWTGCVGEVGRILDKISEGEISPYDGDRLLFQQAYEELIREKRRPPTQSELFQRQWELGVEPIVERHRPEWSSEARREKLNAIYAGELVDEVIPGPSQDTKSYRDKTSSMGLVLLNGHKLRRYKSLYHELKASNHEEDEPRMMAEFVKQSLERFPSDAQPIEDRPFPDLIEIIATPFSLNPKFLWKQGEDLYPKIFDHALEDRTLEQSQHQQVTLLYRLITGFGRILESFIDGLPLSADDELRARWDLERNRIFFRTVEKLGRFPDFCSMWLGNPEWVEFIDRSDEGEGPMLGIFKRLSVAYRQLSRDSEAPTVGQIAEAVPEVAMLAKLMKPEILAHEAMLYYVSLDMEHS